jgi:NAD dependent epimerase/dehydratase
MNLKDKNVLVTGACGFIGSHLVEKLVETGANVKALVYYNSFNNWGWLDSINSAKRDQFEVLAGDIRDFNFIKSCMKSTDVVFHLAALIGIPYSYLAADSYVETNIKGTLNILQAAVDCEVIKIVHTSTSEVYGSAKYVPIDERHPLQGQSPYAATKIGADMLAESFHRSFELPVAICRPFNTYGPRQSARAIIPTIVTQLLYGGKQIQLGNVDTTRDFNYVADTVSALIEIAVSDKSIGEVINVGSNKEISIFELTETLMRITGKELPIIHKQERVRPVNSEVKRLMADTGKIKTLTKWQPLHSLEKGLNITVEWISQNIENYKPNAYNL